MIGIFSNIIHEGVSRDKSSAMISQEVQRRQTKPDKPRIETRPVKFGWNEEGKEKERVTGGGIILTGTPDDDKSSKPATVIAVGPDVLDIVQGNVVYLDWATAISVTVAGNSAAIIQSKHIKAVM